MRKIKQLKEKQHSGGLTAQENAGLVKLLAEKSKKEAKSGGQNQKISMMVDHVTATVQLTARCSRMHNPPYRIWLKQP